MSILGTIFSGGAKDLVKGVGGVMTYILLKKKSLKLKEK